MWPRARRLFNLGLIFISVAYSTFLFLLHRTFEKNRLSLATKPVVPCDENADSERLGSDTLSSSPTAIRMMHPKIVTTWRDNRVVLKPPFPPDTVMWKDVQPERKEEEEEVCRKVFKPTLGIRRTYSEEEWNYMRGIYVRIVGKFFSTIPGYGSDNGTRKSGLTFRYKIAQIEGKGRSVIALEDIPKGTKLYRSAYEGAFLHPLAFAAFLGKLPAFMACDAIMWSYAWSEENAHNGIAIWTTMEDGAMINDESGEDPKFAHNSGCDEIAAERDGSHSCTGFAIRDIKEGEEIVESYKEQYTVEMPDYYNKA